MKKYNGQGNKLWRRSIFELYVRFFALKEHFLGYSPELLCHVHLNQHLMAPIYRVDPEENIGIKQTME